jgi:hypothetical protein
MDQLGQPLLADSILTRDQYSGGRSRRELEVLAQFAHSRTRANKDSCDFTRIDDT